MKYDASNMDMELQAAKRATKQALCTYEELLKGYAGFMEGTYEPENHAYEWVVNTLMQIVNDNPRCVVKSARGGRYAFYAEGMSAAVNHWCAEQGLDSFLRDGPALDMNFARGIAYLRPAEDKRGFQYQPGPNEEPMDDPTMYVPCRISPRDFISDPLRSERKDWMYSGHREIWDKDELLKHAKTEDGWDMKVLEEAVASIGAEEARKKDGIDRDEIVLWRIWCPKLETAPEEGVRRPEAYNGTWLTLIDYSYQADVSGGKEFPRKPVAAFCRPAGPYAFFDALKIPESSWPNAPLVASMGQAKELNAESRALSRGMESWKRIAVVNDKGLSKALKGAPTDTIYHSTTANKESTLQIEVGGLSAEQLAAFQFKRERLDRISGLTEARRGQASTGNTATADTYAEAGAQIRMALLKVGCQKGTQDLLECLLWQLFYDNQVAVFLGQMQAPDPVTGEPVPVDVWHRGGPEDDEDTFDSYDLEIEPYSMERTSEALMQRQAAFLIGPFLQAAAVMPQTPHVPWTDWAAAMSELLNMPAIKGLVNGPVLAQVQALMLQQQVQPEVQTGQTKAPQTTRMEPKPPAAPQAGQSKPPVNGRAQPAGVGVKPTATGGRSAY